MEEVSPCRKISYDKKIKQTENNSDYSVPQKCPANTQMRGDHIHVYKTYANLELQKPEHVACFYSKLCYKVLSVILQ